MFLPSPHGPPLKVGIMRTSSIGDVVLATSCLHLLNQLKMPIEVTWIGKSPSISLIKSAFPSIRCIELNKTSNLAQVLKQLSELHFFIDLQTNLRSRWLGLNFKRLYKRPVYTCDKQQIWRNRLIFEGRIYGRKRTLPERAIKPETLQYQTMAATVLQAIKEQLPPEMRNDIQSFDPYPLLPTDHDLKVRPWQKELKFGSWLAVSPGASFETKRAPISVFKDIISEVRTKYYSRLGEGHQPLGLLFVGDSKDRQVILELLDQLGWNEPVLNLAGKLSLWETALALKGQKCLVSNDSALGHIAETVGTPSSVLFGPTVEGFGFAPRMESSRTFSVPLGCRPCSKHGKTPCRYWDHLCFTSISTDEISEHIVGLLVKDVPMPEKAAIKHSIARKRLLKHDYQVHP
ncbi:MAG: glycosyltransferase family 9 protein [Oligoflexales bacterium]|nr:glycosyltransferase family 9 protein [Oligoflexales bacterium]